MRVTRRGRRRAVSIKASGLHRRTMFAAAEALESRLCLSGGEVVVQGTGGPIALGTARTGSITAPAQTDTLTFHANPGDLVRIALAYTTPQFSSYIPVADVLTQAGDLIGTVDEGGEKAFQLPAGAGTSYAIRVHDDNRTETGDYAVGLDGINPVSPDATPIVCGQTKVGRLSTGAEVDTYSFDAAAGDVVRIASAYTTPQFSSYAAVVDLVRVETGETLGTVDPGTESPFSLPAAGSYLLRVRDNNFTEVGEYAVGLDCVRPMDPDALATKYGRARAGTLATGAEVDTYSFEAAAGDKVALAVAYTTPQFSSYASVADLVTSDGRIIKTVDPGTEGIAVLGAAGTYTIRVHDNNFTETGEYAIGLERLSPTGADAAPIVCGQTRSGSLASAATDSFVFTAAADDVVRVAMAYTTPQFSSYSSVADVVGPSGDPLGTVAPGTEKEFKLPSAGTYTIRVHDDNFTETGVYHVGLDCILPTNPDAMPVQIGQACSGTIGTGAQVDTFAFAAGAGDIVRLSMAYTTPQFSSYSSVADLVSPAGKIIATIPPGSAGQFALSAAGEYTVRVHDDNFTEIGDYAVGLEGLRPASFDTLAIAGAETRMGSISTAETQAFRVYADAGDLVSVAVADTTPQFSSYAVTADLYGPGGTLVGSVSHGSQKQFRLADGGDYFLLVHDDNYTEAGDYGISVDLVSPLDNSTSGRLFADLDGDGQADTGEPGLAGFLVFLDANGNSVPDPGERQTKTDMLGEYALPSVGPGSYDLRPAIPSGWSVTTGGASYHLNLGLAESVVARNFGFRSPVSTRSLFYNNSAFDGRNPAPNAGDDAAIVPGKRVLLPGQTGAIADITGYSRGINGVMVDLPAMPSGVTLTAEDFAFRASPGVTSTEDCPHWSKGPTPSSVTVRRGAGAGGGDRVTLVWPDFVQASPAAGQAVANGWLEVVVKAGARTGLAVPDVFYFGNQIGDTGDSPTAARVNALDLGAVKRLLNTSAGVGSGVDVNHDGRVNALDLGIVKANLNRVLPMLSDRASAASGAAALAAQAAQAVAAGAASSVEGTLAPAHPAKPWDASDDGVFM